MALELPDAERAAALADTARENRGSLVFVVRDNGSAKLDSERGN